MTRRTFTLVASTLILIGVAVRIHNGLQFPVLASYDGFAHFTYIWYLSTTWQIPLPTAGWEFFQPPAYYALMLAFWKALPGMDPLVRLQLGTMFVAILGLAHAAVSFLVLVSLFGLTGAYASEWSLLSMYLLLIGVVTFRARGMFGKKSVLEA